MTCTDLSFCWNQIAKIVARDGLERKTFSTKENQAQLEPLLDDTISLIRDFGPRNLAGTCHKLAKIGKLCRWSLRSGMWIVLESEISHSCKRFNPMGTANVAWALATAKRSSSAAWSELGAAALHNINEFNSQEIANTLWAFATVGHSSPQLFDKITNIPLSHLHKFNSQEIANTVWAYATVGHSSPQLFDKVAEVALP
eukprot:CAMPEP_0171313044 /NCGR_PEP_ID=MMETSP0816-20121228/37157_1 /TAXON_ID=420281 /ORGANISM="Proboscia inermis, Strain CCAP1064/1" /LENGTH=198 /DNA_ID=CAMNT_0011799765 /DNA_START=5 /DNA_END=597 /DNA_ORIENTATION=+